VERSLRYHHSTDVKKMAALIKQADLGRYFDYLSYGDEIGLPAVDAANPQLLEAFREFLRAEGETPKTMGFDGWEQIKPLQSLSSDVAIKIGVLPEGSASTAEVLERLKRLYWYSEQFRARRGIELFADKTRDFKAALGNDVQTTANLGGMHPFFWMNQSAFIESFKRGAMSVAWTEDYTYCQPEASRLVADFDAAYLRKGASYRDARMMFYCMPHWPGNTPEHLMQNAVMQWANNVKDLDWFNASPDGWTTENYIAYRGGLPMWKMLRTISGMAGAIEDDLEPARPEKTPVAMLISQASDLWELQGKTQNDVHPAIDGKPASEATNISQEERKNIWYALRLAGYRVDLVTESDAKDGLLANYKTVYVCGQNLERKAAVAIKDWVAKGGVVFATAGAARKDEFDEPLTTLDETLGRGPATSYHRYHGPMRAKLELLFEKPLDRMNVGASAFDVLASKEAFTPGAGAEILGHYVSDNGPAFGKTAAGKGFGYYIGALPGEAFVKRGLLVVPMGKGGAESNSSQFEPVEFDEAARDAILRPLRDGGIVPDITINHRSVVCGRLSGARSIVLPLVNLAEQHDGQLTHLEVNVAGIKEKVARVWSPFFPKGMPFKQEESRLTITLPSLQTADVLVIVK
ncbi:MAG TPA: hypothetical protein VFC46_00200, partial [Humisphaera sp.]|nr:hypothetical protein [Humisphaera sp.]